MSGLAASTHAPAEEPDLLSVYLKEASRYPLLSALEERSLARTFRRSREAIRATNGRGHPAVVRRLEAARRALIEHNLRLVVSVAKRYASYGMELNDLIQEGNIGLMRAVERFDPDRDVRFSTYATWWIRQSVTRALSLRSRTVRLPIGKQQLERQAVKTLAMLTSRLGREPSVDEVASEVGSPADLVRKALNARVFVQSLDAPAGHDDIAHWQVEPDPEALDPWKWTFDREQAEIAHDLITTLGRREQIIMRMRYGIGYDRPHTLEEIGKVLRLTRERVRQLQRDALADLRVHCSHAQ